MNGQTYYSTEKLNFFYLYPISRMGNFLAPQMGFKPFFKGKNIAVCYLNGNCTSTKIRPEFIPNNFYITVKNFGLAFWIFEIYKGLQMQPLNFVC